MGRPGTYRGVEGHNITGLDTKGRKVAVFVPGDRHAAQNAIDNIHAGRPAFDGLPHAAGSEHDAKARAEIEKATKLRAAANAKRTEAERVASRVGFGDRAAGRLAPSGLRQFNRNTDSSLSRYVAAQGQAENLDHKATLAEARARSATEKAHDATRGAAGTFGQHNIKPGDIVKRRGETHIVQRANAKTVSVPHYESRLADAGYTDTFSYSQITDHRSIDSASTEALLKLLESKRSSSAVKSRIRQILAKRGIAA